MGKMKVAIISDVHNNEINLKKVLDYCVQNEIKKIVCCGDLASMETLDFLNDNFKGEIFFTFGNMDNDFLKNKFCHPELAMPAGRQDSGSKNNRFRNEFGMTYKNTKIFKEFGEAEFDNNPKKSNSNGTRKIAFVHFPEIAERLCRSGKYNFVFYGHTHKPFEENVGNCKMLNPGNVAGEIFSPTFAVWDTKNDKFELIMIHNLNE